MYAQHRIGVVVRTGIDMQGLQEVLSVLPEYVDRIYAVLTSPEEPPETAVRSMLQRDPRLMIINDRDPDEFESTLARTYRAVISDEMQAVVISLGEVPPDPKILPYLLDPIVWGEADFTRGNRYVSPISRKKSAAGAGHHSSIFISRARLPSPIRELNETPQGLFAVSPGGLEILERNAQKKHSWKTLVAIPCFNEALVIGSVVLTAQRYVDDVLVVDDGSSDETSTVAQGAGAKIVRHKVNRGYGGALRTCFEYAKNNDYDVMVTLDGDGQHDSAYIPHLLNQMRVTGADVVIGSRFLEKNRTMPLYRLFGMKILDGITRLTGKVETSDSQSGYRAYGRNAIEAVVISDDAMGAGSEILTQIAEHHLKIEEVPIRARYDLENTSSQNPITHGIDVLDSLVWRVAGKRPLFFIGVPGFCLTVAGVYAGIVLIEIYNQTRQFSLGYVLMIAIFLLFGALGLFMGLTMDVISRVKRG